MNVCTYGYSLAFVDWIYWEKHIDWMVLNGINLPLAFVGQEWLWQEVFTEYGLSFEQMGSFFSGPAFLPWFRMAWCSFSDRIVRARMSLIPTSMHVPNDIPLRCYELAARSSSSMRVVHSCKVLFLSDVRSRTV
jgi:hypothetical protein